MKAQKLMREISMLGPQDLNVYLTYIADRAHELETADGLPVRDVSDMKMFLLECAAFCVAVGAPIV